MKQKIDNLKKEVLELIDKRFAELNKETIESDINPTDLVDGEIIEVAGNNGWSKYPPLSRVDGNNRLVVIDGTPWECWRRAKTKPKLGIKFYVARNGDGGLHAYHSKPIRSSNGRKFMAMFEIYYRLDNTLFPNLKYEDEPIEVEV